jgi:predicted kinase
LTLVVVSGAPGTGKSTIARALGADLRFPVLSLDPVKEALADVLGLGDEDWSNRIGDAAAEVVFRLASAFPDAVAEGWWRGVRRDRAVGEFAGAIEAFCHCEPGWPGTGQSPGSATGDTRFIAT